MASVTGGIDVDDIDETFSRSAFVDYIGVKLHMSISSSYTKFTVFWNVEDDESDSYQTLFSNVGSSLLNPPIIKDKVKIALQHVDLLDSLSILAQFWLPATIEGRRILTTSDQPFGLTYPRKGLCCYRKHCLNYFYSGSNSSPGAEERMIGESVVSTGPPSRVFLHGLPEYSPNVEFYSNGEFPLRDEAIRRKIKSYMAVPVFGPTSQECIGVLELLSTPGLTEEMDKPAYIFGLISTALQGVGLRTSNFACHFNMERSSPGLSHALRDIRNALYEACRKHNLPFAQTWTPRSGENQSYISNVLTTTSREYYLPHTRFSLLRDTCESFQLLRGRGVVWRAFSSGNLCFCRDITMLSIAEYSFAHVARNVPLDGSLAICLKSDYSGDYVFVLELFLPFKTANPRELLESVLLTMKDHLNSFRLASGQKLGDEMNVEVLRVSKEDTLDFFRLFPNTGASVGLQDHGSLIHQQLLSEDEGTFWQLNAVDNAEIIADFPNSISEISEWLFEENTSVSKSDLDMNNDLPGTTKSFSDTRLVKDGSSDINSSASTSRFPDRDDLLPLLMEDQDTTTRRNTFLNDLKMGCSDTTAGRSSAASKSEGIDLETVEKHRDLKLTEAARILEVSPSTLKRKCRKLGIPMWPRKKNQANCSIKSIESNKDNQKHNPECGQEGLNSNLSTEEGTTSSKQNFSQAASVTSNSQMTIKAAYGEKIIIKFQLQFLSRLVDMEMEIASRLKLKVGDFNIWYMDEDEDWILLTCDADLRTMESMGKMKIRVSITHGSDASTS